jgi:hypothetical protein
MLVDPKDTPVFLGRSFDPPVAALPPVNFWLSMPVGTIQQSLIATVNSPPPARTNQVETVFILSCQNQIWKGVGYFVDTNSTSYVYPLFRYDSTYLSVTSRPTPVQIFTNFLASLASPAVESNPGLHHILDGVLHFNVRASDTNGVVLTNGYAFGQSWSAPRNATFYYPSGGEVSMILCSNTLPAAVDIQLGVLEDRALSRASSFGLNPPGNNSNLNYSNYLAQQAGKLHLFRQRVTIPNMDPFAYEP